MIFSFRCMPLLFFMVTLPCQGFEFTMDRREYLIKNQTYCGLLQCQADTISDATMASLIKMDIYYLKNEQLLASMLAVNSEILAHTGNNTIVIGSMSKEHGEFHVYFSDLSNCSQTAFICKIQFKNSSHGIELVEKIILPMNSNEREADIYVKSQIAIEHTIFDKSGAIMKKLTSNTSLMNKANEFGFTLGNPYLINADEISMQVKKPRTISGETEENNFEQKLSDLELKLRTQLELFMNQMSSKIEDIKYTTKETNTNINELNNKDIIGQCNQTIAAVIQSNIDSKLSNLERRMDDIIVQVDEVKVLVNDSKHSKFSPNEINTSFNELIKQEMIKAYEKAMSLLIKNQVDQKFTTLTAKINDVFAKFDEVNISLNDLKKRLNENFKSNDFRNMSNQILSEVKENLEDLKINQRTIESLLVSLTTNSKCNNETADKYNISGDNHSQGQLLKCEKGMTSAIGSRVITSLDNKKQVLCDTESDGGGWIIIQRRVNGKENFSRNWNDYKKGFGSLDGDFWIGNELISNITSKEIYTLRIDMREGRNAYRAEYDSFMMKNESDNYRLHLGVFNGNISDSLRSQNNMAFSTPDRDNDDWGGNCAQYHKSGWWYSGCLDSHLNGVWGWNTVSGLSWYDRSGWKYFDFVEMKLRLK